MPTLTHSAVDTIGGQGAGITSVEIRLVTDTAEPRLFRASDGVEVRPREFMAMVPDDNGYPSTWTVQLAANTELIPGGSSYEIVQTFIDVDGYRAEAKDRIRIPEGAGPFRLIDCLTVGGGVTPIVVGFTPAGWWTPLRTYYLREVVAHEQYSWVARTTNINVEPGNDDTVWQIIGQLAPEVGPPNASNVVKGLIKLSGDLAGTADAPTVPTAVRIGGDLGGTPTAPTVPGLTSRVPTSRTVTATAPLTGGGDLSANRSFGISVGATSGTVAAGNDGRFSDARQWSLYNTAVAPVAGQHLVYDGSLYVCRAEIEYGAGDYSLLSWSAPLYLASTTSQPSSGGIRASRLRLPVAATVSSLAVVVNTAGATLTAGQNVLGIYNTAGTRLAVTADQSTAWTTAGPKTAALTSSVALAAGDYYVAILSVGTTPPVFATSTNSTAAATAFGRALSAAWAYAPSGTFTALPATMTAAAATANYWVGLA